MEEEKENEQEDEPKTGLPKDTFDKHDFNIFWNDYLEKLGKIDTPVYNVLQTANWKIIDSENVELTFDSESMAIEFENVKDDFVTELRQAVNNFYVKVERKVSLSKDTKQHIKTRKDIFNDLVKINPSVETLRQVFQLNIEDEPKD